MKTVIRLFLFAAFLCCSATVAAQHEMMYIEPGSKGSLPEIQSPRKTDVSYVPMLTLHRIWSSYSKSYGSESFADLEFTSPSGIGAEKYVLQYFVDGQWVNKRSESAAETVISDKYTISITPKILNETAYRLHIVGGPYDGKVTNAVEVKLPVTTTVYSSYSSDPRNYVGYEEEAPMVRNVMVGDKEINDPAPYIRHNWYRRNPYTYEITKIEGANSSKYTYTIDDIGYEVFGETCGDGVILDFCVRLNPTLIGLPLLCYPEYSGYDGIIVNTDYILPSAESLSLCYEQYNETTWNYDKVEILATSKTEVVPGQYKLCADLSTLEEWTMVYIKVKDNDLIYPFIRYGDSDWYMDRDASVQFSNQPCRFAAKYNGEIKEATIDFLRPNIDGKVLVATTFVVNSDTTVYVLGGKYYLRARETDATIPTYFPNAANWIGAKMVTVPTMTEDWYDSLFVVNLQPMPVPLTGTGVIEGKVTHQPETVSFARRWMKLAAADNENINVLLYNAEGNLTATTTVSDEGVYRFENLPFGTYSVVVDAAGYVIESNPDITISADNPTADNIDYTITNDGKVVRDGEGEVLPGDANDDKVIDVADITTIAAYILGKTSETFNATNADANQDGAIDVSDITATANIILNGSY